MAAQEEANRKLQQELVEREEHLRKLKEEEEKEVAELKGQLRDQEEKLKQQVRTRDFLIFPFRSPPTSQFR